MWWICGDYCIDDECPYSSPPIEGTCGLGDKIDVAIGSAKHVTNWNGYCSPSSPTVDSLAKVPIAGTGGGEYLTHRSYEEITNKEGKVTGVRVKSSIQHPHGPFGNMVIPTKGQYWCRPWGGFPEINTVWSEPVYVEPRYKGTWIRFHLLAPVRLDKRLYSNQKPPGGDYGLHFKYTFTVSAADLTGLSDNHKGAIIEAIGQMRYAFRGHDATDGMPMAGELSDGKASDWRAVGDKDICLILWIPVNLFYGGSAGDEPIPNELLFAGRPLIVVDINKFGLKYKKTYLSEMQGV